ncbi:hypothetical protein HMI54_011778 [Coelomomyces lativittatus]|nr:hypothetical protein HMI54_011778 [Coelomomyces lativittatus]
MLTENLIFFFFIRPGVHHVKASTHFEVDQCTWSCEINSKIEFQFQFQFPKSTLTQDEMKTINMQRGNTDWFSCSSGFCCNSDKKVNFISEDVQHTGRENWIESKESTKNYEVPYFVNSPNMVKVETNCINNSFCTWKCSAIDQDFIVEFEKTSTG